MVNMDSSPKIMGKMCEVFSPEDSIDSLGITHPNSGEQLSVSPPPGTATQTSCYPCVEFRIDVVIIRSLGARFGLSIVLPLLFGTVFLDVGNESSSDGDTQFGALIMITLSAMMGTVQPAVLSYPEERPVFLREYSVAP
jgi:hypothetical protein